MDVIQLTQAENSSKNSRFRPFYSVFFSSAQKFVTIQMKLAENTTTTNLFRFKHYQIASEPFFHISLLGSVTMTVH